MERIALEYNFLVFLYAYLRQADLSIDRSRWDAWNDLKVYYINQIAPRKVADRLLAVAALPYEEPPANYVVQPPSSIRVWNKIIILRPVLPKPYLTKTEVLYCYKLLDRMDALLHADFTAFPQEAEQLRSAIARFDYFVLEYKLWRKDARKAMHVEHFMQNEQLPVVPIRNFLEGIEL